MLIGGLLLILVVSAIASGTLNVMIERVGYRPLRDAPKLAPLITAVGFSFILQNVGLLWIGGSQNERPGPDRLAGHAVRDRRDRGHQRRRARGPGHGAAGASALVWFISRTRLGKAMRATAQDPDAARLMGINVDTTISLTFLLGGLLAGAAGLIYALYQTTIWFFQGFTAGPDRVHRRGHGRDRQPPRRRPRRPDDRLHPADRRQPDRLRVDARPSSSRTSS